MENQNTLVFTIMFDKKKTPLLPNTNNFQKAGIKNELTNIDDSESGSDDDELPLSRLVKNVLLSAVKCFICDT